MRGSALHIATYSSATVGSGTVLSEVLREYNDAGMLTKEHQEHSGSRGARTPYVQVNYDETAVSGELPKGMRLKFLRYPNGRLVHFTYGAGGSDRG